MDSFLVAILGLAAILTVEMVGVAYWLGRKLSRLESRYAAMESRLEDFKVYEKKGFKTYVVDKFDEAGRHFSEAERRPPRGFSLVSSAVLAMNTLVVDFMALKGLFAERERDYLKAQLSSIASMARLNPITREEAEFVKYVISKPEEEITKEELDKLVEIAKRYFFENPGELSAKFFHYAYAYRAALLYGRRKQQNEATKG